MWTCNNCENTNQDDKHICDVCGATYPNVKLFWKNIAGEDESLGKTAILTWESTYCRSIFAIYDKKTYYLTNKTEVRFPIFDVPKVGVIYFCSSGGYVKKEFTIGHCKPSIEYFYITPKKDKYIAGEDIQIHWKIKNGTALLQYGDKDVMSVKESNIIPFTPKESGDITLTVLSETSKKITKTIPIDVHEVVIPSEPQITYKSMRDGATNVEIDDYVEITIKSKNCNKIKYSYNFYCGYKSSSEVDQFGYNVFKLRVSANKSTNLLKIQCFPNDKNLIGVDKSIIEKYTNSKSIYITAYEPKVELLKFTHTDNLIKRGGDVTVEWKTTGIENVSITASYEDKDEIIYSGKSGDNMYTPHGKITLSDIKSDMVLKFTFKSRKKAIYKTIHIKCKRFLNLYKKINKIK